MQTHYLSFPLSLMSGKVHALFLMNRSMFWLHIQALNANTLFHGHEEYTGILATTVRGILRQPISGKKTKPGVSPV